MQLAGRPIWSEILQDSTLTPLQAMRTSGLLGREAPGPFEDRSSKHAHPLQIVGSRIGALGGARVADMNYYS